MRHLGERAHRHIERQMEMFVDRAHREAEGLGDRQTLGVERLDQPGDRRRDVAVLPPGLAQFHAGEVAHCYRQMVLRIEIAESDRQQPVTRHEAVAEQRTADLDAPAGRGFRQDRDVEAGANGADVHRIGSGLPPGGDGRAEGRDRCGDAPLAQQSRQIEGRQRHMGAEHHHLLAAQKRRRGVEHVAMSVARHRHHHSLRARQRIGTACGDARMKAADDGAARHQRRTRGKRRGAPAGGRPQGDVVPIAAQQSGVPKGDRASSKDGNLHGTTLQFC